MKAPSCVNLYCNCKMISTKYPHILWEIRFLFINILNTNKTSMIWRSWLITAERLRCYLEMKFQKNKLIISCERTHSTLLNRSSSPVSFTDRWQRRTRKLRFQPPLSWISAGASERSWTFQDSCSWVSFRFSAAGRSCSRLSTFMILWAFKKLQ